jgi:hypothetical protein
MIVFEVPSEIEDNLETPEVTWGKKPRTIVEVGNMGGTLTESGAKYSTTAAR